MHAILSFVPLLLLRRVGTYLMPGNAPIRSALGRLVKESYTPSFPVKVNHLNEAANIRDLLRPCLYVLPHVRKPYAFKISKDPRDGATKMQVQRRSYEDS